MIDAEKVKNHISQILRVPLERVTSEATLQELVVDSFILIDMIIELQNILNVRLNQEDLVEVKTIEDLISVLKSKSIS